MNIYRPPFALPNQYNEEYVTRPHDNGTGGGKWSCETSLQSNTYGDVDFSAEFNKVRSDIDEILEPWLDLPKLSNIDAEIDKCREVTALLSGTSSIQDGIISSASNVSALLKGIETCLSSMSGSTITTYKNTFLLQLPRAIGGLHSISVLLGMTLGAEYRLFEDTRRAVAEAVGNAKDNFDRVAGLKDCDSLTVALDIAVQILGGFEKFMGGKLNPAVAIAGKVLDFALSVNSKENTGKTSPGDYENCCKDLRRCLKEINTEVKEAETAIKNNLVKNLNLIRQDKGGYDLKVTPLTSNDVLNVNHDLAMEVAGTYLPSIADDVADASSKTINLSLSSVVFRDDRVGIGGVGPNTQFSEMVWLLYELLKDLSWDTRVSAANFKAAIEMILNEDSAVRDRFNSSMAEINKGSGVDPWN